MNKIFFSFLLLLLQLNFALASDSLDGTPKSFYKAFESLLKSDGHDAEEWDIEIGKRIKTHPTNFLKSLKIYRAKIKRIDSLVGNFGPEFVDKMEAQKKEANLRISALKKAQSKATDKSIVSLADECISELQKF
jgi:hypothetical protein